jgi:hypothetical protein
VVPLKECDFISVCTSPVVYFELNKNKILVHPIVQPIAQVHVSPWVLKESQVAVRVSSTCLTLAQGLLQSVGSHILLALGGHGLLADLPVARGGRHRGSLHAVVRTTGNQPHSLTTGVRHLGAEFSTFPTHSASALGALEANPTGHRGRTDTPEYLHRLPKHRPQ